MDDNGELEFFSEEGEPLHSVDVLLVLQPEEDYIRFGDGTVFVKPNAISMYL